MSKKFCKTNPRVGGQPWILYEDLDGSLDLDVHPFLVVQYESLCRVWADATERKIVLVLDEWSSICNQMHSSCGDPMRAQAVMVGLFQRSVHVIAMDGFLDQMRLDILDQMRLDTSRTKKRLAG